MIHICDWEIGRPLQIDRVEVHKRPKPDLTYGMGLLEELLQNLTHREKMTRWKFR
ncbi:hypothetical protein NC652_035321 [Populus alba x Populus x berolinensis]|nr:hypothetical protein NC652_035321 [Populus alba x Populus x berolinensis]